MTFLPDASPALKEMRPTYAAPPKDYVPMAESAHVLHQVAVEGFSGPLDLLLFLIKRHQLDIMDIPMALLCARYVACLKTIEDLSIDVAAEFMAMAAELLHIKSRMLLPKEVVVDQEREEEDPRAHLVARLLMYQQFKIAAQQIDAMPQLERDVFEGIATDLKEENQVSSDLKTLGAFALVRAMGAVLSRQRPEVRHKVIVEQVPMRLRMQRLLEMVKSERAIPFAEALAEVVSRIDIVVTFLAVLELMRLGLICVFFGDTDDVDASPEILSELYLKARLTGAQEEIKRLEIAEGPAYA